MINQLSSWGISQTRQTIWPVLIPHIAASHDHQRLLSPILSQTHMSARGLKETTSFHKTSPFFKTFIRSLRHVHTRNVLQDWQ